MAQWPLHLFDLFALGLLLIVLGPLGINWGLLRVVVLWNFTIFWPPLVLGGVLRQGLSEVGASLEAGESSSGPWCLKVAKCG